MEVVKEPSPMREARDTTPENVPPPDSSNQDQETAEDEEMKNIPVKPARPPRSRPIIDKSLGGALGAKSDKTAKNIRPGRAAKSIFGVVVGTLKKADLEDKKRNATEAAKKRAIIDTRLQNKIARETATVRRAEENKRDRHSANRKEEELALKESLFKNRQSRGKLLSNFLRTDDDFLKEDDEEEDQVMDLDGGIDGKNNENEGRASPTQPDEIDNENTDIADGADGQNAEDTVSGRLRERLRRERDVETKERQKRAKEKAKVDLLLAPARGHPPALYYLPAILLPSQRRFMEKRREAITKVLEAEYNTFMEERKTGVVEIRAIRQKVEEVDGILKAEKKEMEAGGDNEMGDGENEGRGENRKNGRSDVGEEMEMEEDDEGGRNEEERDQFGRDPKPKSKSAEKENGVEVSQSQKKSARGNSSTMDEDRDDAVEY